MKIQTYSIIILLLLSLSVFAQNNQINVIDGYCDAANLLLNDEMLESESTCNYTVDGNIILDVNILTAENPMDPLNGVSTLDMVLMMKELFIEQDYNNEMIIASDTDGDGIVSTDDIIFTRRIILGIDDFRSINNIRLIPQEINLQENNLDPFIQSSGFQSLEISREELEQGSYPVVVLRAGDLNRSGN